MDMQGQKLEVKQTEMLMRFELYLLERENANATMKKYLSDVRNFLNFVDGGGGLDKQMVMSYKERLIEHYAPTSVNSILVSLNCFFDCVEASYLKVKRLKVQKQLFMKEELEMTKAEYLRLEHAAKTAGKPKLAMGIETLAMTGARISELSAFTVERVRKGRVEIYNKGKQRIIVLADALKKKLLFYATKFGIQKGCIFITRSGKEIDRSNFWREMKALQSAAGVAGCKIFPHNLRHLFARTYYKKTRDLAGLADLLGHSSMNVTRIYTSNTGNSYKRKIGEMGLAVLEI